MGAMVGRRRAAVACVLAAAAALSPGCEELQDLDPGTLFLVGFIALGEGLSKVGPAGKGASGPGNSVVSLRNGGNSAGNAFQSTPFDLHPPFRWEVTGGRLDPESPGMASGFFCTELDERGSNPLEFYSLCAQPSGDGWQVWVSARGTGALNPTTFAAAAAVDFAVEHDGAALRFYARRTGVGDYTLIATLEHDGSAALVPSVGAAQLPVGGQVDFDNARIVTNGPLPPGATIAQVLSREVADAGLPVLHASHDADSGLEPADIAEDLFAAAGALAEAEASVKAAVPTLGDAKAAKQAIKQVKAARKAATKGAKAVERGKPAKAVAKSLGKGARSVFVAAYLLDPRPLPGS